VSNITSCWLQWAISQINWLFQNNILQGRTPLHVSAWQGHVDMVALLLTVGGADVNATDNENRTALHSASWQGHASIVQSLLEHGARPDHTCNQGATALGEMAYCRVSYVFVYF
jgi:ankyrin repeat protein